MKVQPETRKAAPLSVNATFNASQIAKGNNVQAKLSQRLSTGRVNQNNHLLLTNDEYFMFVLSFILFITNKNLALELALRGKACVELDV